MLPFHVVLQAGESPYRQVVFAATRAIVSGELEPGASFPSVRELSQELKINPNTAHKVVSELIRDGLLVAQPGVGTIVTQHRRATSAERRRLLSREVEQLVVEARRLGLTREEIVDAIHARWVELSGEGTMPAATRTRAARRSAP